MQLEDGSKRNPLFGILISGYWFYVNFAKFGKSSYSAELEIQNYIFNKKINVFISLNINSPLSKSITFIILLAKFFGYEKLFIRLFIILYILNTGEFVNQYWEQNYFLNFVNLMQSKCIYIHYVYTFLSRYLCVDSIVFI